MKLKYLFFLIMCFALTGCHSSSIGVIGGADGPTSIIVSERSNKGSFGEQSEKKPVRMFNVDGELYYETEFVNETEARCGTLDGELKKTVKENEIPLKTGEANFKADGYQNATSITKEVCIDGEWVIFKKYDTYGRILDGLKYCHYIKGRLNNAVKDSAIIVLSENEDITFNDVYEPLLSSQASAGADVGKIIHNPVLQDKWGIYLHSDNITKNGLVLKIEQFGGNPSGELQTGADYFIEKAVNDEWQTVETKTGAPLVWNSIAYMIKKNDITEMNIDWKYAYGELEPGYYRLKKEIIDFRKSGDFDTDTYEVCFSIE